MERTFRRWAFNRKGINLHLKKFNIHKIFSYLFLAFTILWRQTNYPPLYSLGKSWKCHLTACFFLFIPTLTLPKFFTQKPSASTLQPLPTPKLSYLSPSSGSPDLLGNWISRTENKNVSAKDRTDIVRFRALDIPAQFFIPHQFQKLRYFGWWCVNADGSQPLLTRQCGRLRVIGDRDAWEVSSGGIPLSPVWLSSISVTHAGQPVQKYCAWQSQKHTFTFSVAQHSEWHSEIPHPTWEVTIPLSGVSTCMLSPPISRLAF